MTQAATHGRRSFAWLNATQFFGALNDNVFKLLLVLYLIHIKGPEVAATAGAIGIALLAAPFLLFSAAAGVLADRVSKRDIVVWAKVLEIVAMALGVAAFQLKSEILLYLVMFVMAAQSTFFSPAKYGILPELVGREWLSRTNGLLQAFTYLAIIFGTVLAPDLVQWTHDNYVLAATVCLGLSVIGTITSLPIERTPPAGSTHRASLFFLRDIWRSVYEIRKDGYLLIAVVGSAYFLMLGAYLQFNLIPYGMEELGLAKEASTRIFLYAALGIGVGSLLAARLSGRNVELGVVPLGALLLTVATLGLGVHARSLGLARFLIFLAGVGSGLFIVPLNAWIQFRSPADRRGEILAASGWLGWLGVIAAAGLIVLFDRVLGLSARGGFTALGWLTLVLTVAALWILPDFFVRFLGVLIMHLCYRLRVIGAENVPIEGPALLVCNHVSMLDAALLLATQQRRIRFLADRNICAKWWLKPILRLMGVIPVSFQDSPKRIVTALKEARQALDEGFLVGIFAEGALSRSGNLHSFKSGFEHIVKGSDYPIVPVYLGGAWGSMFSYYHGKPLTHWPLALPYPVSVLFGRPLPATADAAQVRQAVLELSCDYFNDKKPKRKPLGRCFIQAARANWFRKAVADSSGKQFSYGRLLVGSLALADELEPRILGQDMVGVLLPPTVGGVFANLAVTLLGKVPVNLNYTASAESFHSAIAQCGIRTIITSRAFLQRMEKLPPFDGAVHIEDLLNAITKKAKRRVLVRALFSPARALDRTRKFTADRLATVIFSSGSTGEPKGVMLSHHNILSNIESMRIVFSPSPRDRVCAALPFFHSFGFTTTLWFPLLSGFSAVYHPNPLDGEKIAELVRSRRATLLFATPTFLVAYIRRASKADFFTLRLVIVGAEKLKKRIADMFQDKFGIPALEGYGATELAPVASLNVPDVEVGGMRQVGQKEGSVGHPLPGIAVKIVDPDTGAPLPTGQPGLMQIKGPNVMLGYLGKEGKSAEVLKDGWYDTGDIAMLDKDGFITITDRLSRFSKIGGEMVPHLGVEEALQRGLGKAQQVLAVTAVPDEKRGEKLVVLFTDEAGTAEDVQRAIAESDLPNLWKPAPAACFRIDALPLLGSGKLDLKGLKQKAMELVQGSDTGSS
ncbi:MAG: MFS transporter [Kiritimatiellae bacterium]|nr:MFS transporter [Kiritimatiellia bacterium]